MSTVTAGAIVTAVLTLWEPASCDLPTAHTEDRLEWLYEAQPLEYWIEQLRSERADQRRQAVTAVASFQTDQPKRVRSLLIGMLGDPSPAVREAAVMSLGWGRPRIDEPQIVVEALKQRLIDSQESPQVRRAAARGLGSLGLAGAKALAAAIGGIDDGQVRANAIEWLSRMPHDLYEDIREMPPVREALEQLARERRQRKTNRGDRSTLLREAVQRVEQPQARAYAHRLLEAADRIGDIIVERLVAEVNQKDAPATVRMSAMRRLLSWSDHKAADGAVDALAAALESDDERLRFWAASALAAIDPLAEAVDGEDRDTPAVPSEASDRAVNLLVDHFVREIRKSGDVGEQLSWAFLFATAHADRRDEIFRRIIGQLEDKEQIAEVQKARFNVLQKVRAFTPDLLVSFLEFEDASLRQDMAQELARLGPSVAEQAAPALIEVLENLPGDREKAQRVARAAVEALAKIDPEAKHTPRPDAKALIRLVDLGMHRESSVHNKWIVERFRAQGDAIIDDLVEAVKHPRPPQRTESIFDDETPSRRFTRMLAQLGEPAIPALKRLLIEHAKDDRGRDAAAALGEIEPVGMQVLIELAEQGDPALRNCILSPSGDTLSLYEAALFAVAKEDADAEVRKAVIKWTHGKHDADLRKAIVSVLIDSLQHEDLEIARGAATGMDHFKDTEPEAIVAAYRRALKRDEPRLTSEILRGLRFIGENSAAALPELRELIERNEKYRNEVLRTIAAMGPAARQADSLLREMLNSPDDRTRFWAAVALSQFEDGEQAAVPVLIDTLRIGGRTEDNSKDLRVLAAEALGRIGPTAEPAIEPLLALARLRPNVEEPQSDIIEAGNDPYEVYKVMEAAVAALGKIGRQPEKVVPVLDDLLDLEGTPPQNVTHQAIIALRSFGAEAQPAAQELVERLKGSVRISTAGETLLAIGKPALPALTDALDEDYQVARPAAKLLGEMGETAALAVPELVNVVRDHGVHFAVRAAAIEALGRIGKPARPAIPYLEVLAQKRVNDGWMERSRSNTARQALQRLAEVE